MKNIHFRMIAALLILMLLTTILTGCGSRDAYDTPDHADETESEHVFVPEFTSLSALAGDLPNMSNITIADNTLFFTTTTEPESDALFHMSRIFTLDLDDFTLDYLPNYNVAPPPPEAQGGGVYINAMHVDADGNLWVAEESSFVEFDFPLNFDLDEAESSEIWEHVSSRNSSFNIRKLDSTGAELQSIDINNLSTTSDWFGVLSFHVDDYGNIFIGSSRSVFVLDVGGEPLFSLDTDDFLMFDSLIRLSDGRTAFFNWSDVRTAWTLRAIDVQNKAWGEDIALPVNVHNVFSGFDEYLAIISDSTNLSGIHVDTGEILPIIDWADSIGVPAGLGNVTFLPDGRVLFTTTAFDDDGDSAPRTELITLSRTPRDELPERITLTLAIEDIRLTSAISSAVAEFNRTNALYQMEINTIELGWHASTDVLNRLALEMITGGGPDIIEISNFPFYQWAARGLFVDLYEFIDADPTISRDNILDVVLHNAETNGRLYQIFPGFGISTMTGHPDVVGSEPGWTFSRLISVLETNPQATSAFGIWTDGMSLFREIFMNHVDSFVNWETGDVYFDNDDFIEFLELAIELRRVFTWRSEDRRDDGYILAMFSGEILKDMISSGEIIIETFPVNNFNAPYILQRYFGEDFVFKGYPTESGSGNSMTASPLYAISAMGENKQGAWEFLRMILSEEWQRQNIEFFQFPTNRTVFEERLDRARAGNDIAYWGGHTIYPGQMTQDASAFVDMTLALIDSAEGMPSGFDPLLDIIFEGLEDLFAGRTTTQDAARIIQDRAAIYVAEQS